MPSLFPCSLHLFFWVFLILCDIDGCFQLWNDGCFFMIVIEKMIKFFLLFSWLNKYQNFVSLSISAVNRMGTKQCFTLLIFKSAAMDSCKHQWQQYPHILLHINSSAAQASNVKQELMRSFFWQCSKFLLRAIEHVDALNIYIFPQVLQCSQQARVNSGVLQDNRVSCKLSRSQYNLFHQLFCYILQKVVSNGFATGSFQGNILYQYFHILSQHLSVFLILPSESKFITASCISSL